MIINPMMKNPCFSFPAEISSIKPSFSLQETPISIRLFGVTILISKITPISQIPDIENLKNLKRKQNPDTKNPKRTRRNQQSAELPSERIPPRLEIAADPVFLFAKELSKSDTDKSLNRLFITMKLQEKLMGFLNKEELRAVNCNEGLEVSVIDEIGKSYELVLATWPSMNMVILKKQWAKFVLGNNLQYGDCVEIWGYREDAKFCLASVIIKKIENQSVEGGSSSGQSIITDIHL